MCLQVSLAPLVFSVRLVYTQRKHMIVFHAALCLHVQINTFIQECIQTINSDV